METKDNNFESDKQLSMRLAEFNAFSLEKKFDALWSWGFFIHKRDLGASVGSLFRMNGFYAELITLKNDNSVISVTAFTADDMPAGYKSLKTHRNPFSWATRLADSNGERLVAAA